MVLTTSLSPCPAAAPSTSSAYLWRHQVPFLTGHGVRYEQARAHDGLASAYHATGGHGQARRHWQQALALYTDLGVPAAGRVSGKLSALAEPGGAAGKPPEPGG